MADNPTEMAAQALKCRRLAKWCSRANSDSLLMLADDYERREKAAREDHLEKLTIRPGQPKPT